MILYAVCSVESFRQNPAFLTRSKAKTGCNLNPTQRHITDCKGIKGMFSFLYLRICLSDIRLFSASCSPLIPFLFMCAARVSSKELGKDLEMAAMAYNKLLYFKTLSKKIKRLMIQIRDAIYTFAVPICQEILTKQRIKCIVSPLAISIARFLPVCILPVYIIGAAAFGGSAIFPAFAACRSMPAG